MNIHGLIRGNNVIWYLLYYDELVDRKNYQLSYLSCANEDFYNCAHAVSSISSDDLQAIEKFYEERNFAPSFYTDPLSESWIIPKLLKHGYQEISSQRENWWVMDLAAAKIKDLQGKSFLQCDVSTVSLDLVDSENQLREFMKINQATNALSDPIATAVYNNVLTKKYKGAKDYCLLGSVSGIPAFCASVGIYSRVAYFAEDGVLDRYRRQGLHTYITQSRILSAFAKGAKLACITCSPEAHTNKTAKKLGFSLAFSRKLFKKL